MKQPSWKEIAACPGYKTIKAKYIRDVQRAANEKAQGGHPMRDKPELLKHFNWIISRAKHYAHHKDISIIEILNQWAVSHNCTWLNAFKDCCQPRLDKKHKKYPVSLRGKLLEPSLTSHLWSRNLAETTVNPTNIVGQILN